MTETLGTHPQMLVHGEIFHDLAYHIHPEFRAANNIDEIKSDPIGFVKKIFEQPFGRQVIGFKMWRSQSDVACEYIMGEHSIAKIILERKNRLAHYSSTLLANQTNVWNIRIGEQHDYYDPLANVKFVESEFYDFCMYQDELFKYYDDRCMGDVIYIDYLQATRLHFSSLFRHFGLVDIRIAPQFYRLYDPQILSRFYPCDREIIENTVMKLGHPEWLDIEC